MQSEWFKRFTCACNAFHSKQFFFCIKLICGHRKLCNFIQKLWHNTKEFRYNFDDGEFEKLWHFIFMCGSLWAARLWLQTEKIPTISHWICASTPNTIWNKAKHIQRYFCLVFFFRSSKHRRRQQQKDKKEKNHYLLRLKKNGVERDKPNDWQRTKQMKEYIK